MRRAAVALVATLIVGAPTMARAGDFDDLGRYQKSPAAIAFEGFGDPSRYLPDGTQADCQAPMFKAGKGELPLEGAEYTTLTTTEDCSERFLVRLPKGKASYRASVWMRHGAVDATFVVIYPASSGLDSTSAILTPTGRTTSDGWVELASNDFTVYGDLASETYLKASAFRGQAGTDLDALEVVASGKTVDQSDCAGLGDPVCGPSQLCFDNRCIDPGLAVPVLPSDALRNDVVDMVESGLRVFYGGARSRAIYLPLALAEMEQMRTAQTPWEFWGHWFAGIHALHDWHTDTNITLSGFVTPHHRLNACFFEGDADLSHDAWPKDPSYPDILVSHAGAGGAAGLKAGDRLLAVDGLHPIAWSASLGGVNPAFHVATDPTIYSDYAEELGGFSATIIQFATELTVLRCDAQGNCAGTPETIQVASLDADGGSPSVQCDNRPFYHYDPANNPDPTTHSIRGRFFRGAIAGTSSQEAIFGMLWDTLNGQSDPNSPVNKSILGAIADFQTSARGVILDHRAGNGGTLDAATNMTRLVRPPTVIASFLAPAIFGSYPGPQDQAAGLALFDATKALAPYDVGDPGYSSIPVALITHRDGSASDYMPFGFKGAPHVRIFGPHPTSGAFSTYDELFAWSGFNFQVGTGDTIAFDGRALIGHGVEPDQVVMQKQSDLIAGKDSIFEAALAWVRGELSK